MLLIFGLSHMTGSKSANSSQFLVDLLLRLGINPDLLPVEVLSWIVRKSAHFTEYLLLAVLALPVAIHYRGHHRQTWWLVWLFCVIYAATDEWHQTLIPGREGRATDVLIDGLGAITGIWLALSWRRKRASQ